MTRTRVATMLKRLAAGLCAITLAVGTAPCVALGANDTQPDAQDAPTARTLSQRAQHIDSMVDAYEDDGIIVVYRQGATPSREAQQGISTQSVQIAGIPDSTAEVLSPDAGTPGGGAAFHVDLPQGVSVGQAVAAAEADPDVVIAQPNFLYRLADEAKGIRIAGASDLEAADATASGEYPLPNDPLVGVSYNDTAQSPSTPNQWWIHAVNAPQAWSLAHGDDNPVAVAVLDTGIDFDHEDLKANILADYAYDAYYDRQLTESVDDDEMAHGCHVAGIIAAQANNATGIAGVSYNAKILPIRVFHLAFNAAQMRNVATCSDEDIIRAYDYLLSDADGNGKTVAQETNTRVVNMSLGGYLQDDLDAGEDPEEAYDYLFEDKIEQAEEAGILTVAAAGNGDDFGNARTDASYPSDYAAVMSVVALRTETERTQWSDHNSMKNISAPGSNVYSTYWRGDPPYKFMSGTSMAAPVVAGCAALLWAYDPLLTVRDVKDVLYGTADDLGVSGFDEYYGWGRVNVGAALASLGTATVQLQSSTMVRTTSQMLSASQISNCGAKHEWKWSVDDETVVRVSEDGLLTAVAPGRATVTATAYDDPSITGRRMVEVVDISVPGTLVASASPQKNTISITWSNAQAATRYKVLRAAAASGSTSEPGEFSLLGIYEAASLINGESMAFSDETALPAELYWYQVVPVGELDGVMVEGVGLTSNRCFYTQKNLLKANIDQAEELLGSTEQSEDGAEVPASGWWAPSSAFDALNLALSDAYGAYMSGTMLQSGVDHFNDALTQAVQEFQSQRKVGLAKAENTLKVAVAQGLPTATQGVKTTFPTADLYAIADALGELSFSKESGPAGVSVGRDGAITVSELVPAGTYDITVGVTAAGTETALAKTVSVTVKVKVNEPSSQGEQEPAPSASAHLTPSAQAPNGLSVATSDAVVTYDAATSQEIAAFAIFAVEGAQGEVSYEKTSGSARIAVGADGRVVVAKGTPAGAYQVNVDVTAAGDASHASKTTSVAVSVSVTRAANTMSAKAKAKTNAVSFKKLAKKSQVIKKAKAFKVEKARGKVTFVKASGSKKIAVSKAGKITVGKGLAKGVYKVKVRVRAAGNSNYKAAQRIVSLKVRVK